MSDVLARLAEDPFLALAALFGIAGLVLGITRRSGVPAFAGLICALTLVWGPGVVERLSRAWPG